MRTSFNIPDELLTKFDHTWEHEGLDSRSRAVREAMNEYIEAHTNLEEVTGALTTVLAFDYHPGLAIDDLHRVQDDFQDVITTTNRVREEGWCLETVFCRGEASRVRDLVYQLRNFDDVGRVKLLLVSPNNSECHHRH